ncbi:MAG: ATP-dependent Clp protease proteolytic subunit [Thermoprotei archaeon]|nr:ATP-dependent Clp protease proteolytic subunit [Thermoprotei archaeon]
MYYDVVGLLFWFLLLLVLIAPQWQFRALKSARLKLLGRMEEKYRFRVITLIHRQERIGFLGIPVYRFIDIEDSETVIRAIRSTPPDVPIALIIHTPGGLVLAAVQIALALKRHKSKKVVIIPHYAMSGGTLIALAADEIWMDPDAVLGPLDPQLTVRTGLALPAPSILRVAKMKGENASDTTLMLADVAEKALREVQEIIVRLISDKVGEERARRIAEKLTQGAWTHDYPLTVEEAKKLGLPVKEGIPPEVYQLMELYPQAHQQRPGIEYLPYPIAPMPFPGKRGEGK